MPRNIQPKTFLRIFSAQLSGAATETDYRERLATLERHVNQACTDLWEKEGFIASAIPMVVKADGPDDLVVLVVTNPTVFVGEPPQLTEVPPGTVLRPSL